MRIYILIIEGNLVIFRLNGKVKVVCKYFLFKWIFMLVVYYGV